MPKEPRQELRHRIGLMNHSTKNTQEVTDIILKGITRKKSYSEIAEDLKAKFPDTPWNDSRVTKFIERSAEISNILAKLDKRVASDLHKVRMEIQDHYKRLVDDLWDQWEEVKKYDGKNTYLNRAAIAKELKTVILAREKAMGRLQDTQKLEFKQINILESDEKFKELQKKLAQAQFKEVPETAQVKQVDAEVVDEN